ncbi:hypothetical protein FI667_g1680, partial [Globisporangium splendens]
MVAARYLHCCGVCSRLFETFYLETRAVYQELDTLKETIYEQEIRLREMELDIKEKQQSLDFLLRAVQQLPVVPASSELHDKMQQTEREKWQRYCWELEERLHNAVHTSNPKERDLWKTRDAKKEEARKNRLLYMDAQKGKRHYDPLAAVESSPSPRAIASKDSSVKSPIPVADSN